MAEFSVARALVQLGRKTAGDRSAAGQFEQGDLAEAWREGAVEYATVGMRFALADRVIDRASGRTVEGGEPGEVTELWTFMRARGGDWLLSAIQQT